MSKFKKHRRKQIVELRPVTHAECRGFHQSTVTKGFFMKPILLANGSEVYISSKDRKNGSPKIGDMIGRNPENHKDQWLINKKYYDDNFEVL